MANIMPSARNAENRRLFELYRKKPTTELRHQIAENNIPILLSYLGKMVRGQNQSNDADDFLGAFHIALMNAIDHYDLDKGHAFSTYLYRCLFGAYMDQIKRQTQTKKNRNGDGALKRINTIPIEKSQFEKFFGSDNNPDGHLDASALLARSMRQLTAREISVIRRRFFKNMTLKEVGAEMGVTKERVRQIETRALQRMRAVMPDDMCA